MQDEMGPEDSGTQIRVLISTRNRLARNGRKNESYDGLINRLLDHWNQTYPEPEPIKMARRPPSPR